MIKIESTNGNEWFLHREAETEKEAWEKCGFDIFGFRAVDEKGNVLTDFTGKVFNSFEFTDWYLKFYPKASINKIMDAYVGYKMSHLLQEAGRWAAIDIQQLYDSIEVVLDKETIEIS